MSPELALTELRRGLEVALWVGGPLLVAVLVVGVVVGVVQAATQINEPTIAFIAKAAALYDVSEAFLRRRINEGQLSAVRCGRQIIRIGAADLAKLFRKIQSADDF